MKVNIYHPLHHKMPTKRTTIEKPQHSNQTIHTTFSTYAHILIYMWQDINKKLEKLK